MEEGLLGVFGIDWRLIAIQMINFFILVGALSYFLYKPILKIIDSRSLVIKKGLSDAKQAEESLAKTEEDRRSVLMKAEGDARDSVEAGKKKAEEVIKKSIAEAEARRQAILLEASKEAEQAKVTALKEAEQEIARLVVLGSKAVLEKTS